MQSMANMSLQFGLASIPVKLFAATEDHDTRFHQYHEHGDGFPVAGVAGDALPAMRRGCGQGELLRGAEHAIRWC